MNKDFWESIFMAVATPFVIWAAISIIVVLFL